MFRIMRSPAVCAYNYMYAYHLSVEDCLRSFHKLFLATAIQGKSEAVRWLLAFQHIDSYVVDINTRDDKQRTALMLASINGHVVVVRTLLEEGVTCWSNETPSNILDVCEYMPVFCVSSVWRQLDINAKDRNGRTALMHAAWRGDANIVSMLLNYYFSEINAQDEDGKTALMIAVLRGQMQVVRVLLKSDFRVIAKKNSEQTKSADCVTENCHIKSRTLVRDFIYIDVSVKDKRGMTAFMHAAIRGEGRIISMLWKFDVDVNVHRIDEFTYPNEVKDKNGFAMQDHEGRTVLMLAVVQGCEEVVDALLEAEKNHVLKIIESSESQLDAEIQNNHISLLINAQDPMGNTALMHAISLAHGAEKMVKKLLAFDASIRTRIKSGATSQELHSLHVIDFDAQQHEGKTALMLSLLIEKQVKNYEAERVRYWNTEYHAFIVKKRDWKRNKFMQLHLSDILLDHIEKYKAPVQINAYDYQGNTALMHAVQRGFAHTISRLLLLDPCINACNMDGGNALHCFTVSLTLCYMSRLKFDKFIFLGQGEKKRIIDLLQGSGLNINSSDFDGATALHLLAKMGDRMDFVEYFVSQGADVNVKNKLGETPLHKLIAVRENSLSTARFLKTSNPQLMDIPLKTALENIACHNCRRTVMQAMSAFITHPRFNKLKEKNEAKIDLFSTMFSNAALSSADFKKIFTKNLVEYWFRYMLDVCKKNDKHIPAYHYEKNQCLQLGLCFLSTIANTFTNETDKRGRNYLHLFLILQCNGLFEFHEIDKHCNIEDLIINMSEAANCTDYNVRTALHYLALLSDIQNPNRFEQRNYAQRYIKSLVATGDVHAMDKYERTALQYVTVFASNFTQTYKLLQDNKCNVDDIGERHSETVKELESTLLKHVQTPYLNKCVREKKKLPDKMSIQYEASTGQISISSSHNIHVGENYYSYLPAYNSSLVSECTWKRSAIAYRGNIAVDLTKQLNAFISRLVAAIGLADSRLEASVTLVGSAFEGTRIGFPDEFDFDISLTKFAEVYQLSSSPVCPNGYAILRRKTVAIKAEQVEEFFDENGFLLTSNLQMAFEKAVKKVLRKPEFWKDEMTFELDIKKDAELYSYNSDRVCMTLTLIAYPACLEVSLPFHISIDIVPCIHVTGFWPDDATQRISQDLASEGWHFVFDQSQKIYPWIPYSVSNSRTSFSVIESRIILSSSAIVKIAFMIGKHFIRACETVGVMKCTSHVLKIAVLYSLTSLARNKTKRLSRWTTNYDSVQEIETKNILQQIFHCLLQFYRQNYVRSYFMSEHYMRVSQDEKFLRHYAFQINSYLASLDDPFFLKKKTRKQFEETHTKKQFRPLNSLLHSYEMAHCLYRSQSSDENIACSFNFPEFINSLVERPMLSVVK